MLTRIKKYIDYKGVSISAFEKSIGMSNASFGKSLKTGGSIGGDKLEKILSIYPDINPEWLLTGIGSMLRPIGLMSDSEMDKQDKEVKDGKWHVSPTTSIEFSYLIEKIQALTAENALLKRENEDLKLSRGNSTNTPTYDLPTQKIGTHTAAEPGRK